MLAAVALETRVWRDVSWKPLHGPSAQLYGEADFDPQGRPRTAATRLLQATSTTDITLNRTGTTGNNPRWAVKSRVGGGTVDGEVELAETGNNLLLSAKLMPANVEVASVMEAFNRRSDEHQRHTQRHAHPLCGRNNPRRCAQRGRQCRGGQWSSRCLGDGGPYGWRGERGGCSAVHHRPAEPGQSVCAALRTGRRWWALSLALRCCPAWVLRWARDSAQRWVDCSAPARSRRQEHTPLGREARKKATDITKPCALQLHCLQLCVW